MHAERHWAKALQTHLSWISVTRPSYAYPDCGTRTIPRDAPVGLTRDSRSPGERRLTSPFGALPPFAPAVTMLAEADGIHLSASTVRTITEAVG